MHRSSQQNVFFKAERFPCMPDYRRLPDTSLPPNATWPGTNILRHPGLSGPVPPPYGAMKGTYGLPPYTPVGLTTRFGSKGNIDESLLRAYAQEKLMGCKESASKQ